MELTNKQEQGLRIAIDRYLHNEKYTVISGYAGTGKTTLVRFIIDALGLYDNEVCFACYTGKACQVLLQKGNKNVRTLHKLLYDSFPKPEGGFFRKPKLELDEDYKLIVVDEVSMAPKELMDLLFRHRVHVICLGDPFQLPPVDKNADNHLLDKPHIFLDEIMRQAAESEIIRLSTQVRNYERIDNNFKGKEVKIFNQNELNTGALLWADQIIVGTNQTRTMINNTVRQCLGRGDKPEDGDKVIWLRSEWDSTSEDDSSLVNGTIGYLQDSFESFVQIPMWAKSSNNVPSRVDIIQGNLISDFGETYRNLSMDKKLILEGVNSLDWKTTYKLQKSPRTMHLVPYEFTYGYAITCHKAQGSEYSKLLIYEEGFPYIKEEHARWLYTALTRGVDEIAWFR